MFARAVLNAVLVLLAAFQTINGTFLMFTHTRLLTGLVMVGSLMATTATAQERSACQGLPSHQELREALTAAQGQPNGGFSLEMWATVVNRDGVVCAVVFTGQSRGDQWPGSRVISA